MIEFGKGAREFEELSRELHAGDTNRSFDRKLVDAIGSRIARDGKIVLVNSSDPENVRTIQPILDAFVGSTIIGVIPDYSTVLELSVKNPGERAGITYRCGCISFESLPKELPSTDGDFAKYPNIDKDYLLSIVGLRVESVSLPDKPPLHLIVGISDGSFLLINGCADDGEPWEAWYDDSKHRWNVFVAIGGELSLMLPEGTDVGCQFQKTISVNFKRGFQ